MDLTAIFNDIQGSLVIWIVLTMVAADVILGIMVSFKKHRFKSSINKQGIINKSACVVSILFFYTLDLLLGLHGIGFSELFASSVCMSELISIAVNLKSLEVPLPKAITQLLDKYTAEKKDWLKCIEELHQH